MTTPIFTAIATFQVVFTRKNQKSVLIIIVFYGVSLVKYRHIFTLSFAHNSIFFNLDYIT